MLVCNVDHTHVPKGNYMLVVDARWNEVAEQKSEYKNVMVTLHTAS